MTVEFDVIPEPGYDSGTRIGILALLAASLRSGTKDPSVMVRYRRNEFTFISPLLQLTLQQVFVQLGALHVVFVRNFPKYMIQVTD